MKTCDTCINNFLNYEPTKRGRGNPKVCIDCIKHIIRETKEEDCFKNYSPIPPSNDPAAHMRRIILDSEYEESK